MATNPRPAVKQQWAALTVESQTTRSDDADEPTKNGRSGSGVRRAPASSCTSTTHRPWPTAAGISSVKSGEHGSAARDMQDLLGLPRPMSTTPTSRLLAQPQSAATRKPEPLADGDTQGLSQREVLLADREHQELFHLVG